MSLPPAPGIVSRSQRKVAFLGSHGASLPSCPWFDPSWEFWGHASARAWYKHELHRYFDIHRPECWDSQRKGDRYLKWLRKNTTPIYMQERYPDFPASRKYPKERLLQEYGGIRRYVKNHLAWMTMMAFAEGVSTIGLWGINYGHVSEYDMQRGSAEYWLGRIEERGIRLILPEECTLLSEPKGLYGYESHDERGVLLESYKRRIPTPPESIRPLVPGETYKKAEPPEHIKEQMAIDAVERPSWALGPLNGKVINERDGREAV